MKSKTLDAVLKRYNNIMKESDELYRAAAKKSGLSECEFWILYYLRTEYGEPMQSEICSSFYLPKQSIHSALKKLEAEGCLMRTAGGNKRSKRILLTKQGEALCAKTVDPVVGAEKEAFGSLPAEEQGIFMDLFGRYTEQLKKNFQIIVEKGGGIS